MITFECKGDYAKTKKFLASLQRGKYRDILEQAGKRGVAALASATPRDSGATASSWNYEIHGSKTGYELIWTNANTNNGANIAIILQYGHGTGTGGYVQGIDYINPAIKPIFDDILKQIERGVRSS